MNSHPVEEKNLQRDDDRLQMRQGLGTGVRC